MVLMYGGAHSPSFLCLVGEPIVASLARNKNLLAWTAQPDRLQYSELGMVLLQLSIVTSIAYMQCVAKANVGSSFLFRRHRRAQTTIYWMC